MVWDVFCNIQELLFHILDRVQLRWNFQSSLSSQSSILWIEPVSCRSYHLSEKIFWSNGFNWWGIWVFSGIKPNALLRDMKFKNLKDSTYQPAQYFKKNCRFEKARLKLHSCLRASCQNSFGTSDVCFRWKAYQILMFEILFYEINKNEIM